MSDAAVLSSFSYCPDSIFTMLFGSGHNVYGISQIIGFHSDVGFINYLWEFGIFGTLIMFIALAKVYVKGFKITVGSDKFLIIFLMISYVIVLFKAILIGYNPGVVVNYLLCFSMIYCAKKTNIATKQG